MKDIIAIKLVSGSEVMGYIDSEDDEYVNIDQPIEVVQSDSLYLMPFMSYCEESLFTFRRKDIMVISKPSVYTQTLYLTYLSKDFEEKSIH